MTDTSVTTTPAADPAATETPAADQATPATDPPAADAATDTGDSADTSNLLGDPDDGGDKADGDGKDEKASGAPEEYADFTVPDGLPIDADGMAAFKDVARDLGLTQEQAQSLVDLQSGRIQAAVEEQAAAWAKRQEDWQADVRKDKEIGGSEMPARIGVAKKAIAKFGSPELRKVLTETGLGNHPELIRFAYRVGKSIADDSVILPSQPGRRRSAAETLYGPTDN